MFAVGVGGDCLDISSLTYQSLFFSPIMRDVDLTLYLPVTKIAEFANSVDLDEVAHNEPPHLDLHCLPLVFEFSIWYSLDLKFFENLQTKMLLSAFQ